MFSPGTGTLATPYNYRDASRAGRIRNDPTPSRGGDLELEGSVLVKIWRSTWNTYLVRCLNVVVR